MRYIAIGFIAATCFVTTACNRTPRNVGCDVVEETYVHKYGVPVPQQDWQARGEHGQVISTLKDGVIVTKQFNGGILDGDTTYTFPHSNLIEKIQTYSKGTLTKETLYYHSGVPMQETLIQANGSKNVKIWYENGSPKNIEDYDTAGLLTQGQYYDGRNQLEARIDNGEGIRHMRDAYGQLLSKDTIQGGVLTTGTTYHPNGSPKEITPYVKGVVEGERRTYLPAGEPNTVEQWVGGKQHGATVQYQNGEKVSEATYVNGSKTGLERHYRDGSEVIGEISWKSDQKHGPSTSYAGENPQTEWFLQGKPVSKAKFDSSGGALAQ